MRLELTPGIKYWHSANLFDAAEGKFVFLYHDGGAVVIDPLTARLYRDCALKADILPDVQLHRWSVTHEAPLAHNSDLEFFGSFDTELRSCTAIKASIG